MLYSSTSLPLQSVKDVAVELCDAVGGQHVHVLEHVPEGSNICSLAPEEYPLRLERSIPACKVLRGEVVIPAHSFWGRFSSSVPCHVVLKQDAPCDAESGGCTQRLHIPFHVWLHREGHDLEGVPVDSETCDVSGEADLRRQLLRCIEVLLGCWRSSLLRWGSCSCFGPRCRSPCWGCPRSCPNYRGSLPE